MGQDQPQVITAGPVEAEEQIGRIKVAAIGQITREWAAPEPLPDEFRMASIIGSTVRKYFLSSNMVATSTAFSTSVSVMTEDVPFRPSRLPIP